MKIQVLNETTALERRVALTPEGVAKLRASYPDVTLEIEAGAGALAQFPDADYTAAGATVTTRPKPADILLRVTPLTNPQAVVPGGCVVGFQDPLGQPEALQALAQAGISVLAMEKIPRISRAQSMDALSSQTNLAGYKAVLVGAAHYGRVLPLMMTAAGSLKPARVVVLGVGVAGLQAIATARRLGAQVEAFDIRPETREQVQSLGAKFIEFDLGDAGSGEGGYARALTEAAKHKQQELLQAYLAKADIVITTALVPGRPAPELVTAAAVQAMRPGSVIVDMAAAAGGNCKLTQADQVVVQHGVTLVGYTNLPSLLATDASTFYSRNLVALLQLLLHQTDGQTRPHWNVADQIIAGALAAHQGEVRA